MLTYFSAVFHAKNQASFSITYAGIISKYAKWKNASFRVPNKQSASKYILVYAVLQVYV